MAVRLVSIGKTRFFFECSHIPKSWAFEDMRKPYPRVYIRRDRETGAVTIHASLSALMVGFGWGV
jgi:hypothetical protein